LVRCVELFVVIDDRKCLEIQEDRPSTVHDVIRIL
jgi:hypothetical protein